MSETEEKVLKIYDGSRPVEEDLFERSYVNQVAWTLAVVLAALLFWTMVALVNAENQRYALLTKQCQDPVFKGETDLACLQVADSRPHFWQHIGYAMTHLHPEDPKKK
jgi:hypothetical protein